MGIALMADVSVTKVMCAHTAVVIYQAHFATVMETGTNPPKVAHVPIIIQAKIVMPVKKVMCAHTTVVIYQAHFATVMEHGTNLTKVANVTIII